MIDIREAKAARVLKPKTKPNFNSKHLGQSKLAILHLFLFK